MNRLTSLQRKLVYLAGIILLLIPIIVLGLPGSGSADDPDVQPGGVLAHMRSESWYDLGESSLGDVDPTSSAMNLVLLGMRGIAANLLHLEAIEQKRTKQWGKLRNTTKSIIMLQPHYIKVWQFQGWNLAYNVSTEWDDVRDRYYWVKEGVFFYIEGTERNSKHPELFWHTGNLYGKKFGRSDEWVEFRQFFYDRDPNPATWADPGFPGPGRDSRSDNSLWEVPGTPGPDVLLNSDGLDNYLVAKQWFQKSNDVSDAPPQIQQHIMAEPLYRSYPARSQLDYATAFTREGRFGERGREAWETGYNDWTAYGRETVQTPAGPVIMEVTDDSEFRRMADENNVTVADVREWVGRYQDMTNYRYWRTRALSEREQNTMQAHRDFYRGKEAFNSGSMGQARQLLESGMERFRRLLRDFPELKNEDETLEEGLAAVLRWQQALEILGVDFPEDFPLRDLWDAHQNIVPHVKSNLDRD